MKKFYSLAMLFAVAAMAFTSCSKSGLSKEDPKSSTVFHITASSTDTKTVFGAKESSAYPTLWTTNKDVYFSCNEGELKSATPTLVDGGKSATFSVDFGTVAETGTVYAFSPVGIFPTPLTGGFTNINASYEDAYLIIPSEQKPLANSVDEAAQAIVAKAEYDSSNPNVNMTFNHVVAYGKMAITNFAGSIKSVSLLFPENVVGTKCYYHYKTGVLDNMDGKQITLDPENVSGNVFWFALAPTAGNTGEMKIVITDTDNKTYTKTINLATNALPFVAGQVSSFTANFSGIPQDAVEPIVLTAESGFPSSYTDKSFTWQKMDFSVSGVMYNGKGSPVALPSSAAKQVIQLRKNNGVVYNTSSLGVITNVTLHVVGTSGFSIYCGSSSNPATNKIASTTITPSDGTFTYGKSDSSTGTVDTKIYSFDLSSYSANYFKLENGTAASYFSKIIITYEE